MEARFPFEQAQQFGLEKKLDLWFGVHRHKIKTHVSYLEDEPGEEDLFALAAFDHQIFNRPQVITNGLITFRPQWRVVTSQEGFQLVEYRLQLY